MHVLSMLIKKDVGRKGVLLITRNWLNFKSGILLIKLWMVVHGGQFSFIWRNCAKLDVSNGGKWFIINYLLMFKFSKQLLMQCYWPKLVCFALDVGCKRSIFFYGGFEEFSRNNSIDRPFLLIVYLSYCLETPPSGLDQLIWWGGGFFWLFLC